MGELRETATGRVHPLAGRTMVGRARLCQLRVPHGGVSKEHAVLWWEDGAWWVRDLGSRNGTLLNGAALEAGQRRQLRADDALAFGTPDQAWVLTDDARPPAATGFTEATAQENWAALRIPEVELCFHVSLDEEHVELEISNAMQVQRLPSRSHLYVLVLLARAWADDTESAPAERGWVDREQLCRMLNMGRKVLNVQIHRARKQLADAGVLEAERLVERRAHSLRLACQRAEVRRLAGGQVGPG